MADTVETQTCPHCGKEFPREDFIWVKDHYGIPFKKVCYKCADLGYAGLGGQYYDESDECIDEDY